MSRKLSGWREWILASLSLLDALNSPLFLPSHFVVQYLVNIAFRYFMPFILMLHYSIDGLRWQLYPLYFQLFLIMLSMHLYNTETASVAARVAGGADGLWDEARAGTNVTYQQQWPSESNFIDAGSSSSSILAFLSAALRLLSFSRILLSSLSFFLCSLFPFPSFPEPDGIFAVGVEEFQFTTSIADQQLPFLDEKKKSPFFRNSNARPFQTLLFYPIEKHRHQDEGFYRWLPGGRRSAVALGRMLRVPSFFFDYLLKLQTHSVMLAPLSKKRRKHPIVFFSHGLGMMKTSQSLLCQVLVVYSLLESVCVYIRDQSELIDEFVSLFYLHSVATSLRC